VPLNFALEKNIPETQAGGAGWQAMNFERMPTQTKNWFKDILHTLAFFGAFFLFAAVGSLVSMLCVLPAMLFREVRVRFFGQKLIHWLFWIFVGYMRRFGLVELEANELSGLRNSDGLIVVANHPCLLDAVLMVSQMPRAVCLMKGSLARNIIFSGTARLAGYIHNKSGLGLVKKCEERLNEGTNLLVFPEGTRTVGGKLLPFKMGFALAAVSTRSPVQTVIIEANSNCLGKGQPLFKVPAFPLRYSLRQGERFVPAPGEDAKHFGGRVENYFREKLSNLGEKSLTAAQVK
jgi:1-acyl-sn-glycerol-3-phosphate acyltransferase